jgi:hypothetical protein
MTDIPSQSDKGERKMKSKEMMTKLIAVVLLVVFAVVSFAALAKTAADPVTYSHTLSPSMTRRPR